MNKTKIDWCDVVWNPVWGCRHSCPYCYARTFARRFGILKAYSEMKNIESPGWTLKLVTHLTEAFQTFQPTFLWSNFNRAFPRKPARIFVNSMSDIAFWKPDWMDMVLQKIGRHPEHSFLFLTKAPRIYSWPAYTFPKNCWLGSSAVTQGEVEWQQDILSALSHRTYLSLEPILEEIDPETISADAVDWLIMGAETGNRKIGGFDPDKLQRLAESIQAVGVQQPIVVRPNGQSKFEIVAGERRWKAARIAGLLDIPAVIRDLDDVTVLKIQTIENFQRENIHSLDEAEGYARLIEKAGYDIEHLAQDVGRSPSYVYQRLKLQDLVDPARKMLADGEIPAGHAILIARLQPQQQEELVKWLKERCQWDESVSVRALDDWIHRTILLELHKAAVKKDDAELVPVAGPCTTCPKRTGYQPALFADVCKKDYCTDPDCFNSKLDALVERRRQEIKGEEHMEVMATYLSYNEEKQLPATIKKSEQWEECKKKDEGAVHCLVVGGSDRGRLTWGVERKQTRYGYYEKSPQEKAEETKRKRKHKILKTSWRRIWDEIVARGKERLSTEGLQIPLLRIMALKFYSRLWDNHRKMLCQLEGWEKPKNAPSWGVWEKLGTEKISSMTLDELRLFVVKCALIDNIEINEYRPNPVAELEEVAVYFDVDPKAIEATVREEEKAREAAKAARKTKSKKKCRADQDSKNI